MQEIISQETGSRQYIMESADEMLATTDDEDLEIGEEHSSEHEGKGFLHNFSDQVFPLLSDF